MFWIEKKIPETLEPVESMLSTGSQGLMAFLWRMVTSLLSEKLRGLLCYALAWVWIIEQSLLSSHTFIAICVLSSPTHPSLFHPSILPPLEIKAVWKPQMVSLTYKSKGLYHIYGDLQGKGYFSGARVRVFRMQLN